MIRATTPTYILSLPQDSGIDLTQAQEVHFTLQQNGTKIDKIVDPTDGLTVEVMLEQAETLNLKDGRAEIQLNWIFADGRRGATYVSSVRVDKQLLNEVLT